MEECMRTWILGSTIGTAVVARDSLDQLLQTTLVAHLLALVDGSHVCPVGVRLFTRAVGGIQVRSSRWLSVWLYPGSGAELTAWLGVLGAISEANRGQELSKSALLEGDGPVKMERRWARGSGSILYHIIILVS